LPDGAPVPSEVVLTTENYSDGNLFGNRFSNTDGANFVPTLTTGSVAVNVWPENTAPVVSAGEDKSIRLPNGVTLVGTVTDDRLPDPPGTVTIQWSKVAGPGTVTFSAVNNSTTEATFSQAGTYVLRLSADDSELSATDEVTVVVEPAPEVYFITPDLVYVEIGANGTIPVEVRAANIDVNSLVFDFVTTSVEVFGNAAFE